MEALTVSMWYMGALAQKEAIAMRIITVTTLIFLPATFASVCPPPSTSTSPVLTLLRPFSVQISSGTRIKITLGKVPGANRFQ